MNRILSLCITVLALTAGIGIAADDEKRPPNIVFIIADDLGYGDLSCYGAPDLKSPNIDALFEAGMRFDQFYANCPVCSPSRAAILTGFYPDNAGVPGVIRTPLPDLSTNWGKLREDVPLMPAVLKKAGYHTAIVGKWHLGMEAPDRPNDRGFDFFHGFLGDMMDDYYDHLRHGKHYMRKNLEPVNPEGHATDIFTQWASDYLRERGSAEHRDQPFYLYLAYNAPHTPIQPPQDWYEKVKAREPGIDDARAKLVALIEHLDHGVGQVIETLKETGAWDNTLIVFTSDNGGQESVGARNAPLRGGKQDMWEGGIRVGTCVVWPGKIAPGQVNGEHVSLGMDFYPTLAEIAGAKIEHEIDARSFAPLLLGQPFEEAARELYWVRLEGNQKYGGIPYHAVRIGDWKLLRNTPFEPYEMFNLSQDTGEMTPVPRQKAPKKYDELFKSLLKHINLAGKVPWQRTEEGHNAD
ncbi:MAG: sulfatase-like hydrolase/transferase [Verrucomicrobiae bacterium]|nr:sulfatase-like hydrolase/transferase [Verrucomicrobiae bacterium]